MTDLLPGSGAISPTPLDLHRKVLSEAAGASLAPGMILAATLGAIEQGVIASDVARRVVICNDVAARMLALPEGLPASAISLAEIERIEGEATVRRAAAGTTETEADSILRLANGTFFSLAQYPLPDGGCLRIYTDVTRQHHQAEALRLAAADYESLFQNAVVGIYRSSIDGRQLRANPMLARLNGFETEAQLIEAINRDGNSWYVDPDRRAEFKRRVEETGYVTDFVSEIITTGSRKRIWVSETAWLVRDENGEPAFYEGTVVEASQRMEAEARNAHLALHDEVTGLPNRASFRARLAQEIVRATPEQPIALFCLDLDHFKEINDTLGHDAGDRLLREVGERLQATVRASDLVARLGGDEFALVLRGLSNQTDVHRVADALLHRIRAPLTILEREVLPSISIGIAFGPQDAATDDELYRCADAALYEAKAKGRNGWSFFNASLRERSVRRREIGGALDAAIAENALVVTFEPQVSIANGSHVGFEARVEWRAPGVEVSPQELIGVAEETGQMLVLGDHILDASLKRLADLIALGREPGHVALNVGAAQLKDSQFPDRVASMLAEYGLPHSRLELELTEDVMLDRSNGRIRETLERLHKLGISIAIDDFGSGYASVTQLKRFPIDKVKIGLSFVRQLGTESDRAVIPMTILNLAQGLGLTVVAEGVESDDQFATLSAHRCDFAQGELVAAPLVDIDAIIAYLDARSLMVRNSDAFFL